jgi:PAS domain S-box-containing protein
MFKSIFDSAPDAVIVVDSTRQIILANKRMKELFGYTEEEIIGKTVEFLIPNRLKEKHISHRNKYHQKPEVREMGASQELLALHKNGHEFYVEISLSPIKTENGNLVSAAIRDVSDKVMVNKKLKETINNLQRKQRELEEFSYVASHDLKAPLTNLMSLVKMLAEDGIVSEEGSLVLEKAQTVVNTIHSRLNALNKVIAETGSHALERQALNFEEVLQKILVELSEIIKDTETNITFNFNELTTIDYPPHHLHSILLNMITNAIRYKKENEAQQIHIKTIVQEDNAVLIIKDKGMGMDLSMGSDKIFGLFKRYHTHVEGQGIGLYIVKSMIQSNGGHIDVDSEPGIGTTFKITL